MHCGYARSSCSNKIALRRQRSKAGKPDSAEIGTMNFTGLQR
jgi:hypothetical protein